MEELFFCIILYKLAVKIPKLLSYETHGKIMNLDPEVQVLELNFKWVFTCSNRFQDQHNIIKRKKKIVKKDGTKYTVICKYERSGEFCFPYRMVTHTDKFCRKHIDSRGKKL